MQTFVAPTPSTNGGVQKKKITATTTQFQVFKTTDYDKFKLMADNRNINLLHVKRLVESFRGKHLISPIIVNEKYEVIDGQHRLQASIETGMPVYFIVLKGYGITEVQIFNSNQKNWTKVDYLHSYCSDGKKAYLEFKEFMTHFPEISFQACERLLSLTGTGKKSGKIDGQRAQFRDFEEGKFVVPNLGKSYLITRKIMDLKPFYSGFGRGIFASAMLPLLTRSKVYNHKEMLHKLSNCPIKLTDCHNVEAYRMLLEDIYNYKRQKENKVSFRYE